MGQNFLVSIGVVERILQAGSETPTDSVVEIGPGRGALTLGLAARARRVVAIEKDPRLASELTDLLAGRENVHLLCGDALETAWSELVALAREGAPPEPAPVKLVANLPYDVGTTLVLRWLEAASADPRLGEAVVMLQAEVAERLGARVSTKEYGSLGAIAQSTHRVEKILDVAPSCFSPPPKVWSRVVRLRRRESPAFPLEHWAFHAAFVQAAFAHRRKQLAPSLAGRHGLSREDWRAALAALGVREDVRAEALTPEELAALAARVR